MIRKNKLNSRGQVDKGMHIFPKSKGAQVTIFIILALIIVVVIILLFVIFRKGGPDVQIPDIEDPQRFIEFCSKEV